MTGEQVEDPPIDAVEHAMNEVLQAERNAEQAIEACRHDAMKIQQAAQQQAKQIARRTNERLAICHLRCNARLTRDLKERERAVAARQGGEAAASPDEAALTAVVEALALALTGIALPDSEPGDR